MGNVTPYNASSMSISKICGVTGEKVGFLVSQGFYGVPDSLKLGVLSNLL